ncbi:unnamed protein product [Ectocarpus sp. CCAP 1310/34]|nr:unnamed protein product [Ectocarpus sp. CCAP 1310/34]
MVLRSAWDSCIATLLLLSFAAANGGAGGFFGRQTHQRSRQLVVGEVQQPLRETVVSQVVGKANRERRLGEGTRGILGCLASTATRTFGMGTGDEATNLDESKQHATASAAEPQSEPGTETTNTASGTTATNAGVATRWRTLPAPLGSLSSTREHLVRRASSTAKALRLREGKDGSSSTMLLTRGGGGGAPAPPPSSPQQGMRLKNAVEGLKNGLASGLAAACVKTVLQPFDTMKTVQQFSTTRMTLLQAGRDLLARGGVPELYQGLGVTLVGSMPAVGVYFGLYQFVKNQMDAKQGISPYLSITVSAGVGNFIASFFRVPYEVVKQRLQVGQYPTTMVAIQSIYHEGGLVGFFGKGGLKTQWARDIPYAMVTLLVYETLQKAAARRKGPPGTKKKGAKANPIENMVIGAIAGGMGSLVTNPMDMIKTRMMTSPELYAGPMDAAWKALSKEGPQAFLKGATPRLLHKIPANAFFFVAYEFFRSILGVTR